MRPTISVKQRRPAPPQLGLPRSGNLDGGRSGSLDEVHTPCFSGVNRGGLASPCVACCAAIFGHRHKICKLRSRCVVPCESHTLSVPPQIKWVSWGPVTGVSEAVDPFPRGQQLMEPRGVLAKCPHARTTAVASSAALLIQYRFILSACGVLPGTMPRSTRTCGFRLHPTKAP